MKTKKLRLKRWVKNVLWVMLGAFIGISIYTLFTIETNGTTPNGGTYTCKGTIVKVCTGDYKAYKYFE